MLTPSIIPIVTSHIHICIIQDDDGFVLFSLYSPSILFSSSQSSIKNKFIFRMIIIKRWQTANCYFFILRVTDKKVQSRVTNSTTISHCWPWLLNIRPSLSVFNSFLRMYKTYKILKFKTFCLTKYKKK